MKDNRILISHILDSIAKIEDYTKGMTYDVFITDQKTMSAVVRELTVIGEASAAITEEFREAHPDLPLYEAIGMRNRIVHEYWDIDAKTVWDTSKNDLPILKDKLSKI
jgi:uncharacterized protein with HEPN domain